MTKFIVHDFFRGIDGGERVVLTLAEAWGWPVITGEIDEIAKKNILYRRNFRIINLSIPQRVPLIFNFSQIVQFWWGFSRFLTQYLENAETIIFSGQLSLLGIRDALQKYILYCHTPPRILYDSRDCLLKELFLIKRPFMRLLLLWYKYIYEKSIKRMCLIIANSKNVQRRIKRY